MKQKIIFMDYASGTPVDKRVIAAMEPYYSEKFYNPAASYSVGRQAKIDLVESKKRIAKHFGVVHSEVVVTSGASEANNLAIRGVMEKFPSKKILVSSIEHDSVIKPAGKYNHSLLSVDNKGLLHIDQLENIDDDTVLLSVMLANNEVGSIQPIRKIAEKIRLIRCDRQKRKLDLPLYFHTDAAQAPLYLDVNAHRLGVDTMSLNGGKIYGPKQAGVLFVSKNIQLQPQILGGGQQRGLRSGSESPAYVAGLAEALDLAADRRESDNQHLWDLQNHFIDGLKKINPNVTINGPSKRRLPSNVHATFPGTDNERLLFLLDEAGIMAAAGSACSASSSEPSHVLSAMGTSKDQARSSIRFTLGRATTKADIDYTVEAIKKSIA